MNIFFVVDGSNKETHNSLSCGKSVYGISTLKEDFYIIPPSPKPWVLLQKREKGTTAERLSSKLTVVETQCPRHEQIEAGKTPEMSLASSSTLNCDDIGK